jgi:hypothetical protein
MPSYRRKARLATVGAALVFATAAWSHPAVSGERAGAHSSPTTEHKAKAKRFDTLGWIGGWFNNGTCHGYPDGYDLYVLYGNAETGEVTSWTEVGGFSPTCGGLSGPGGPAWTACGCSMWDGYIQGDPNGTTTWDPSDGICDGCIADRDAPDRVRAKKVRATFSQWGDLHFDALRAAGPWRTSLGLTKGAILPRTLSGR